MYSVHLRKYMSDFLKRDRNHHITKFEEQIYGLRQSISTCYIISLALAKEAKKAKDSINRLIDYDFE